jgi:hypothetical protein
MRSRLDSFCYSSRLHAVCIHHGTWKHLHAYRDMRAQAFNSMVYGDLLSSSCSLLMTWRIYRVCFAQIPSLNISAAMGDGAKGERGNGRSGGRGGRRGNGAGGAGEASPRESPRESPRCARARAHVCARLHAHVHLHACANLCLRACVSRLVKWCVPSSCVSSILCERFAYLNLPAHRTSDSPRNGGGARAAAGVGGAGGHRRGRGGGRK